MKINISALTTILAILLTATVPLDAANLTFAIGTIEVKRVKSWQKAAVGFKFIEGDIVKTGTGSVAVIKFNNGSIKLYPKSRLVFTGMDKVRGADLLDLKAGVVFSKIIRNNKKDSFSLRANTVVASVRGTEFYVAFKRKFFHHDIWVCVNEGLVNVRETIKNKEALIPKGKGIRIIKGKKLTDPKRYKWTEKLNWNMDPQKGAVIEKKLLEEGRDIFDDDDY